MDKVDGNEDGFIDLSKKTVLPEDILKKKAHYEKCKIVHLIMKQTAYTLKSDLLKLYEDFGWDMYDAFEHAYDAFKLALS